MKKKRRKNKKREGRKEEEKNESLLDSHPRSIIIIIFTNITLDPSTMGLSTPSLTYAYNRGGCTMHIHSEQNANPRPSIHRGR